MKGSLSKSEIAALYGERRGFKCGVFSVLWSGSQKSSPRVAFAFARNIGKSHVRNLFRRRWRSLIVDELKNTGVDLVISTRSSLTNLTKMQWLRQKDLFKKLCHEKIKPAIHHSH